MSIEDRATFMPARLPLPTFVAPDDVQEIGGGEGVLADLLRETGAGVRATTFRPFSPTTATSFARRFWALCTPRCCTACSTAWIS